MRFRVDAIKEGGLFLESAIPWEDLPILADIVDAKDCVFLSPVQVSLRAQLVGTLIEVEGTLATSARFECGGCLKDYVAPLECRFELTFARELPQVEDDDSGEPLEVNPEELGIMLFHGDEIDLTEAIQEQVAMALPIRRRCQANCKGLCSQCGADLNAGECGCSQSNISLKFAALKDFKVDKSS
jgi:uncharacterized protein